MWHLWLQVFSKEYHENTCWISSWGEKPIQMWHLWLQLFFKATNQETCCQKAWKKKASLMCKISKCIFFKKIYLEINIKESHSFGILDTFYHQPSVLKIIELARVEHLVSQTLKFCQNKEGQIFVGMLVFWILFLNQLPTANKFNKEHPYKHLALLILSGLHKQVSKLFERLLHNTVLLIQLGSAGNQFQL